MNNNISINENFLSITKFDKYLSFSKETNLWGNRLSNNVWSGRVIYVNTIDELHKLNIEFLNEVKHIIKSKFNIKDEIYPDYLGIVKWESGDMQHPHADGELENKLQHQYHWRNFGCVLYLNDDYTGGEIYFPNQNIEIKPKPNTLVFFPGTLEYLHGVKPINDNIRYTLTSFWTFDKNHSMSYYDNNSK
jgi:hypothetical protein